MSADLRANIQSDLFFGHLKNDKTALNIWNSQHKLKLTNLFDNMSDHSIERNNEFQISLIKHLTSFFNKQSKSKGNVLLIQKYI